MSYVPVYEDGRVARTTGIGADPTPGVPPYVTAIIQQIEAKYPLNTDSIQKLMDAFSKVLSDEAKKEAMERAAVATGMAVADIVLDATIVGAWIGILLAVVMAVINAGLKVTQTYFQNQANVIVADTQNYLRTLAAQYQARLLEYQGTIIEQEAPAAYQLAVSGATLQGLGAWQANLARDMRRAVTVPIITMQPIAHLQHSVIQSVGTTLLKVPVPVVQTAVTAAMKIDNKTYSSLEVAAQRYEDLIKAGTGEAQLSKTQEAADKLKAEAVPEFERQYAIAIANCNLPQFRASLRNALAAIFRTDPSINSLMSQLVASVASGTTQSLNMTVKAPSSALQAVPMMATGVAAAAALLFFKR